MEKSTEYIILDMLCRQSSSSISYNLRIIRLEKFELVCLFWYLGVCGENKKNHRFPYTLTNLPTIAFTKCQINPNWLVSGWLW